MADLIFWAITLKCEGFIVISFVLFNGVQLPKVIAWTLFCETFSNWIFCILVSAVLWSFFAKSENRILNFLNIAFL
jgi:hypothetical protein